MEIEIRLPRNLDLLHAIEFCNGLWNQPIVEKFIFNFVNLKNIEPFSMAYVATEIKRFRDSRHETSFEAMNHENHDYAAHMGFFRAFGLRHGNAPGEANGSTTYLPLTILNIEDLRQEAIEAYEHVGQTIENRSNSFAKMLTRQEESDLVDTLTFSFREIMRNVIEHSESTILEYCAQYWPTKHKVEIVVLDSGIGVKNSLSKNPYLNINNDREAIQLALMPSISGKMYKGVTKNKKNIWQNSGFGLYMTNRICRNGGSFFICSGESGLLLQKGSKKDIPTNFKGTAIRMVINTQSVTQLSKSLEKYRDVGYRMARAISDNGSLVEASVASMMLSKDFDD